ncbi:MAG: DUF502 domain-containing protein [Synergistaceae bacterium]|nr:DUF502 domain-containing protein [Synergistaceae bacterium]
MGNKKQENEKEVSVIGSRIARMAKDFFLGCIALIPLAVFVFIFYYLIMLFEALGAVIFGLTKSMKTTVAVTLIIVLLLMYTGRKLRRKEKWFLNIVDQLISKIPVIGGWYATFQDMVQTFTAGGGERGYLGTAKVPCGDGYIIGFVTKREKAEDGSSRVTIFVPTSPNPTTGLVFFFPEDKIEYLDLTPEKAFAKIISLGMKS